MSPGRFLFFISIFTLAVLGALLVQWTMWRAGVLAVIGCISCIAITFHMGLLSGDFGEPVGEIVRPISEPKNAPSDGIFWAGHTLTFEDACKHFVTVGATGSGKSITLNLLMQSVFARSGKDRIRRRALVYDSKSDLVSLLAKFVGMQKIRILNPLDKRFVPWNIAADVQTETDALEFASILIPKSEHESSPYFSDAARSLVAGVIIRFNATAPKKWTLRDLILAFDCKETLKEVLDHPQTRHLLDHFSPENEKNFAGVKSTVDNTMALYRPIAALFEMATKDPFSLQTWLTEDSVLVFGNSESAREATDTLNRLMFRQISKLLINRPGKIRGDETWIFLDELREAGALQGLRQLLLRGRSKGVAVAMGFQDVEGIYAAYGEHEGAEIVGAAQNAVLLHLNPTATQTAEWASKVLGSRRDVEVSESRNLGDGGVTRGESKSLQIIPNVLPMQFSELPMPSEKNGLRYYAFTENGRYMVAKYSWKFLESPGYLGLENKTPKEADFESHSENERRPLRPWDNTAKDSDRIRLGIGVEFKTASSFGNKLSETGSGFTDQSFH